MDFTPLSSILPDTLLHNACLLQPILLFLIMVVVDDIIVCIIAIWKRMFVGTTKGNFLIEG